MPGSGRPIEPGLTSVAAQVGDHDPAGLGLPPVVVDRLVEGVLAPTATASGFSGSPTLAMKRSAERSCSRGACSACAHEHPHGGRRRVPDADPLALERLVPALGVELRLVDDHRHAVCQRRDDPVGDARHPAGVGRAPEDVLSVQVERHGTRRVVGDDGLVHVHAPFGAPGGAAREVQQREVLRVGGADLVVLGGVRQRRVQVARPRALARVAGRPDQEHVLAGSAAARGSARPCARRARAWSRARGRRRCARRSRTGSGPKAENSGAEDAAVLERAEGGDVELRAPRGQGEDALAADDAEAVEDDSRSARSRPPARRR